MGELVTLVGGSGDEKSQQRHFGNLFFFVLKCDADKSKSVNNFKCHKNKHKLHACMTRLFAL